MWAKLFHCLFILLRWCLVSAKGQKWSRYRSTHCSGVHFCMEHLEVGIDGHWAWIYLYLFALLSKLVVFQSSSDEKQQQQWSQSAAKMAAAALGHSGKKSLLSGKALILIIKIMIVCKVKFIPIAAHKLYNVQPSCSCVHSPCSMSGYWWSGGRAEDRCWQGERQKQCKLFGRSLPSLSQEMLCSQLRNCASYPRLPLLKLQNLRRLGAKWPKNLKAFSKKKFLKVFSPKV